MMNTLGWSFLSIFLGSRGMVTIGWANEAVFGGIGAAGPALTDWMWIQRHERFLWKHSVKQISCSGLLEDRITMFHAWLRSVEASIQFNFQLRVWLAFDLLDFFCIFVWQTDCSRNSSAWHRWKTLSMACRRSNAAVLWSSSRRPCPKTMHRKSRCCASPMFSPLANIKFAQFPTYPDDFHMIPQVVDAQELGQRILDQQGEASFKISLIVWGWIIFNVMINEYYSSSLMKMIMIYHDQSSQYQWWKWWLGDWCHEGMGRGAMVSCRWPSCTIFSSTWIVGLPKGLVGCFWRFQRIPVANNLPSIRESSWRFLWKAHDTFLLMIYEAL